MPVPKLGVIFDMDGVLADTEGIHLEATRAVLGAFGIEFGPDENRPFIGMGEAEFWSTLRRQYALTDPAETLAERRECALLRIVARGVEPMAGARDLVRRLERKKVLLAVASSSPPRQIEAILAEIGLREPFSALISGESPEVKRGKPAPDIYRVASEAIGLPTSSCIAVEDSENGVRSAREAGCIVVAVPCRETEGHDFSAAHHVIANLKDFDLSLLDPAG